MPIYCYMGNYGTSHARMIFQCNRYICSNVDSTLLMLHAMPQLTNRTKLPSIIDPVIRGMLNLKHLYQVAVVVVLCVQLEPSYRPLITNVLHILIPLVPMELGGSLSVSEPSANMDSMQPRR